MVFLWLKDFWGRQWVQEEIIEADQGIVFNTIYFQKCTWGLFRWTTAVLCSQRQQPPLEARTLLLSQDPTTTSCGLEHNALVGSRNLNRYTWDMVICVAGDVRFGCLTLHSRNSLVSLAMLSKISLCLKVREWIRSPLRPLLTYNLMMSLWGLSGGLPRLYRLPLELLGSLSKWLQRVQHFYALLPSPKYLRSTLHAHSGKESLPWVYSVSSQNKQRVREEEMKIHLYLSQCLPISCIVHSWEKNAFLGE